MKQRRYRLIVMILAFILSLLIIAFALTRFAPASTGVETTQCLTQSDTTCIPFPRVRGDNLNRETLTFPDAFEGTLNLVVMPFDRDQQTRAIEWLPVFQEIAAENSAIRYYSIAALPDLSPVVRTLVIGGLDLAVKAPDVRARTVVLFLDNQPLFAEALGVTDMGNMQVFIINQEGEVLEKLMGDYDVSKGTQLREAVARALP